MSGGSNPFLGQSNPYLQQNIDNVNQDVVRAYNTAAVPGQTTAGIKSGSFGNSGLQQMQLQDQQNLQKTLANNATLMRGADYNQQQGMYQWQNAFDANRYDTTFGQNQQQFNNYLNLLDRQNAYNQQDVGAATNIYNTPLGYQTAFGNMAAQYGGLGGGSSQSLPGSPVLGGIGGYMAGSKIGGSK